MTKHPDSALSESAEAATTALYFHAAEGQLELVRRAVEQGADKNARHTDNRMTSLHKAITRRNTEVYTYLLSAGADPDVATIRGYVPLHTVATANNPDIVNLLLDYNADPNAYSQPGTLDSYGETPLLSAGLRNSRSAFTALLRAGADPLLPVIHNESLSEKIPDTFSDLRMELEHYSTLPRIDEVEDVSKATLLAKNEQGFCPLDNPVTWRQWEAIAHQLNMRGESFSKAELQQSGAGQSYLQTAIEARSLDALLPQLHRQGEALQVADIPQEAMTAYSLRRVFTRDNMVCAGDDAFERNYRPLDAEQRSQIPAPHTLRAELDRVELAQNLARGR
jgi:hypothetical protein